MLQVAKNTTHVHVVDLSFVACEPRCHGITSATAAVSHKRSSTLRGSQAPHQNDQHKAQPESSSSTHYVLFAGSTQNFVYLENPYSEPNQRKKNQRVISNLFFL